MASTTNSNSPDFWKISAEERAKHNATFNQLNPDANGYLSGEQAKAFLIKSGLPPQTLAQIWNLADLNKDGKLDKKEFSIACFLVKKTLNGVSVPMNLPPTLLVDPQQAVIELNKTATTLHNPTAPSSLSTSQPNLFSSLLQPSTSTTTLTTNRTTTPVIPMTTTMLPSASLFPLTTTITATTTATPSVPSLFPTMPLLTTVAPVIPTANPTSIMPLGSLPPTLNNPSVNSTIGGGIPPIPTTSRNKFSQMFQSNDPSSSGFLNGSQAKMLLMQTGLSQQLLAQIWQLSDFDNDGRLSHEEFILAMHLCDYAKSGNVLPTHLPAELQPTRARATSLMQPITSITPPPSLQPVAAVNNDPNAAKPTIASFEDKRKENFDRGNAVLEAKRQMLREQAEREKREREEKERLEQERKQKIKDEQEKKRLADLEKQRMIETQRDEERKKAIEQREAARQELLRQQRIEWELQRRNELEIQRVKLQEQISILKAKDKNLEYEMQQLNDKITSSKQKIRDTQSNLSELNIHIDTVKKSLDKKMSDCEVNERYVKDYTESLRKSNQEKLYLSEKLKNMNQDNPFAETYRNESLQYKQEQTALQQMKDESHRLDVDISTMRTQIECLKHEIEASKQENVDILKQNDRIVNTLLNLKRNDFKQKYPSVQIPQISQIKVTSNKDNYDAFKEEINKIQITSANNSLSNNNYNNNTTPITTTTSTTMPNISTNSNNNNTATAATTISSITMMPNMPNSNSNGKITTPNSNDVWSSAFDNSTINNDDPFKMISSNNEDPFNSNEDPFMSLNNGTNNDPFSANFADNIDPFNDNNQQNDGEIWGFNNNNSNSNHANLSNNNSNFNSNNDSNWASFDDAFNTFNQQPQQQKSVKNTPINSQVTSPTSPTSPTNRQQQQMTDDSSNAHIKDIINKFNTQTTISPPKHLPHLTHVQPNDIKHAAAVNGKNGLTPTQSKCRALFRFDGERSDELSLVEGDIIIVDTAVKSDDGWSWGTCKGRSGVFPSNYAEKLTDLEVIHEEQSFNSPSSNQMQFSQPHTNGNGPTATYQNIADSQHPTNSTQQSIRVVTIAAYSGKKENHLTFNKGDIITVREQNGAWWSGELNGKIGWFPPNYVKTIENHPDVDPNYQLSVSGHHGPSTDKNNYISLFAFETNEPGDLNFGQYEIINVVDMKDEWYTGVIESTKQKGIFPSNFVKKFGFPIDYIHKFSFAIAAQDHFGQTEQELSINVNDIIAIMQLSPDNQWSYGEKFDELTNQTKRGWFLTENALPIQISTNNNSATTTIAHNTTTTTTTPNNIIINTITSASASTLSNNTTTNNNNNTNLYANVVMTNNNNNNNNNHDNNDTSSYTVTSPTSTSNSTNYYNNIAATSHSIVSDNLTTASNKKFQEVVASNDHHHHQQQQQSYSQQQQPEVVLEHQVIDQVIALYDFQSTIPDAISFPKDAIIKIFKKDGDWLTGEYNGLCGILPSNYVQSINQNHQSLTNSENTSRKKLNKKEIIDRDYNSFESDEEEVINDIEMNSSDSSAEKLKMRSNVTKEILQTEINYIQNLNKVVELYYNPLKYNKVLTDQELHTIFVNWHQIIEINTKFQNAILHRIEETKRQKQTVVHIGDILLSYLPKMKPYCEFVSGRQFGEELIIEKMKTSPEFNDIMNKTTAGDSGEFILKKLLILPMQRVTQYSLLIDKLLKYVDESDDDYPKLKKSSKVAVDLIKMINDEVGKKHDFERLQWLEEHIPQARSIGLKFDSSTNFMGDRRLLYYGPFVKESGKELFGFLFNDLFLIIEASQSVSNEIFKTKTKQFQIYKTPMMLDTIRAVQSRIGQSNMDTSFQIVTEREFLFRTSNPTIKNEWIKQLQKAIQDYKEKKLSTSQGNTPVPINKTPVGRLLLIVMEAQDLYMELGEEQKPNSFCEVKMGVGQKFFTQTIDGSANPKWNISLQFQIYDLKKDVLTATVYDQKIYSPNKCLGKINLSITQIYKEQLKENNPVTRVFPLAETKSGKIMLKMNITMYQ